MLDASTFRSLCDSLRSEPSLYRSPDGTSLLPQEVFELLASSLPNLEITHADLKVFLEIGDPNLFRALVSHFGSEPLKRVISDPKKPLSFKFLFKQGNVPLLEALHQTGFDTAAAAHHGLAAAVRKPDTSLLDLITKKLHPGVSIAHCDARAVLKACSPACAPEVARILKRDLQDAERAETITHDVFVRAKDASAIKSVSALVAAGCYPENSPFSPNPVIKGIFEFLVPRGKTAHGRMELAALEPSLENILSRKPGERFFGKSAATLFVEQAISQTV